MLLHLQPLNALPQVNRLAMSRLGVGDPTLLGEYPQPADSPSLRPEPSQPQPTNGRHSHENCVQRWRNFVFCLPGSSYESSDRAEIFCRDCRREFLQMAGACLPQSQSLISEIWSARLSARAETLARRLFICSVSLRWRSSSTVSCCLPNSMS